MGNLNDILLVDGTNYPLATYMNKLFAGLMRAEYSNTETLTATKELSDADYWQQILTASGADRTVELAPEGTGNHVTVIYNTGTTYNITVKDDSGTVTFIVLKPDEWAMFIPVNGETWMTATFSSQPMTGTPGGRLTLTSGSPVTTADVTGATTLYYTPFVHNQIALWNGTRWVQVAFAETSLALGTMTNALPYDVFGYLSNGALALEKLAWSSGTARATAITLQDGRYCKSGDKTRLYLGTFRTTSTTQTEDSRAKRLVWNMYNRVNKSLHYTIGTNSWTYTSTTWRQANADATAQVEIVVGLVLEEVSLKLVTSLTSSGAAFGMASIGEDSTTTPHADAHYQGGGQVATAWISFSSSLDVFPASVGYHYYAWLESASAATITFYGGTGASAFRGGLNGRWMC